MKIVGDNQEKQEGTLAYSVKDVIEIESPKKEMRVRFSDESEVSPFVVTTSKSNLKDQKSIESSYTQISEEQKKPQVFPQVYNININKTSLNKTQVYSSAYDTSSGTKGKTMDFSIEEGFGDKSPTGGTISGRMILIEDMQADKREEVEGKSIHRKESQKIKKQLSDKLKGMSNLGKFQKNKRII